MTEKTSAQFSQFDIATVRFSTDDFSDDNKLGQCGFGVAYKGKLPDGLDVVVKRLYKTTGQGDSEFKNEVLLVARLEHRNLARILGFCVQGEERILIYEFFPNASLDHFIFDPIKRSLLNWEKRYEIIKGIARGILYLHEGCRPQIIHGDLRARTILLDEEMDPKISDAVMARLFPANLESLGHVSDVFSFGLLVLEIISGKRSGSFFNEDLIATTWKKSNDGTASDLIDPILQKGSRSEIMRCIHIALLCVQEDVAKRPTMHSVVLMLSSSSASLSAPQKLAFSAQTDEF